MSKSNYQIPFDKHGNQMDYEGWRDEFEMRDNFQFSDELVFEKYGRGRSSVTFTMRRKSNGKTVSFFVSDFTDIVPKMVSGRIAGEFTFVKKGQNYGCKLVDAA